MPTKAKTFNRQAYNKEYYEANKESIKERMKETKFCKVCKKEVTKHNYHRHKQTTKHKAKASKQKEKSNDKIVEEKVRKVLKELLNSH